LTVAATDLDVKFIRGVEGHVGEDRILIVRNWGSGRVVYTPSPHNGAGRGIFGEKGTKAPMISFMTVEYAQQPVEVRPKRRRGAQFLGKPGYV
jgi:hypothetical protein